MSYTPAANEFTLATPFTYTNPLNPQGSSVTATYCRIVINNFLPGVQATISGSLLDQNGAPIPGASASRVQSLATATALNAARAAGGRIVCVGTTSLRLLESATAEDGEIKPFHGDTAIFITPGYRFRAVDVLMTNFHLPKSTLFMLVSAFAGTATMKAAYAHAVADGYRFYSYGDGSLLFRD